MAKPYRRKGSRFWYIAPWIDGRQVPQSSGYTDYEQAERKLKILEGRLAAGTPIHRRTDRGSFGELLELVRTDYAVKLRRSAEDLGYRIDNHLSPALGHFPAVKVNSQMINEYILKRQYDKAKPATINRELAVIKRAFTLGMRSALVSAVPYIEMLPEDNARAGFFTDETFQAITAKANPLLADILLLAFTTGWRIESVITLEWENVDIASGVVSLRANQTKNRMATVFPLDCFPDTLLMLKRRRRDGVVSATNVFTRDGAPVKSIRKAWENTRRKAKLSSRLLHDLRRTAVRNLKALGFSDTDVMKMVGLKTLSIFHRYNITTAADIMAKSKAIAAGEYAQVKYSRQSGGSNGDAK